MQINSNTNKSPFFSPELCPFLSTEKLVLSSINRDFSRVFNSAIYSALGDFPLNKGFLGRCVYMCVFMYSCMCVGVCVWGVCVFVCVLLFFNFVYVIFLPIYFLIFTLFIYIHIDMLFVEEGQRPAGYIRLKSYFKVK